MLMLCICGHTKSWHAQGGKCAVFNCPCFQLRSGTETFVDERTAFDSLCDSLMKLHDMATVQERQAQMKRERAIYPVPTWL